MTTCVCNQGKHHANWTLRHTFLKNVVAFSHVKGQNMTTALHPTLHQDLTNALTLLRDARADGDPQHNPARCPGCVICIRERHLNRLLSKLPRQETP